MIGGAPGDGGAPPSPDRGHGVGPWKGDPPVGDWWDEELLRDGDRRNVVDKYRYWRHDAIVADLDASRHAMHIAVENWQHDLNIGSVVRTGNAFNVAEVHIVGRRRWNRRGAMVTDKYQHIRHHETIETLVAWASGQGLPLIGVDNFPDAIPLETYAFPERCLLLFGQEGPGLSEAAHEACEEVLSIEQFGSTRSINASAAAAIAMHAWIRQRLRPVPLNPQLFPTHPTAPPTAPTQPPGAPSTSSLFRGCTHKFARATADLLE